MDCKAGAVFALASFCIAITVSAQEARLTGSGSGFFVSADGYFLTNYHVVEGASEVRIKVRDELVAAKVTKLDPVNDIAVLKAAGEFRFLRLGRAEKASLGQDVFTIGFSNPELQGFAPKLTRGEISAMSGLRDDPRLFQISIPLQPGNSGGPLIDEDGNVVGIINASLSAWAVLKATGALPQNVNFAIKVTYALPLLGDIPVLAPPVIAPGGADRKKVVSSAEEAVGLVLLYTAPSESSAEQDRKPQYAWKTNIVTALFWIGEPLSKRSYRTKSCWDPYWLENNGGIDAPQPGLRRNYVPEAFVPRQNPFYCALPYNDVLEGRFKPEASAVIPWFKSACTEVEVGRSVCKDRWLAIRKGNRLCFAQWEDCGPIRNNHFQYVFEDERPSPNRLRGAGLAVSPAVRDYLGLGSLDVTDWKFVEVRDVAPGPWRYYGDNNHFVIAKRQAEARLLQEHK